MKLKKIFFNKFFFYLLILVIFSFSFNQYYAFIGVLPVDSFSTFNAGYDILNGSYPFKDFWSIKGPFLDLLQSFFFGLFGVSWFSYAAHASFFNSIFALSTFLTLNKFQLELRFSFFYSLLASILMYPTYGIPFTDHHAAILCMLSVYLILSGIKTDKKFYWLFLPIILFLAFFVKQAPSGYFIILIGLTICVYLIFYFNNKFLFQLIIGSLISIIVLIVVILFYEIPIKSFMIQYFFYPISLGNSRLEWLFPLEFKRVFLRHKLIYLSLLIPIYLLINESLKKYSFLCSKDALIFILLISTGLIFIAHQLMTINGLFIFFLIPVFCGFSHLYINNYFKKNKLIYFFLILSLVSTIYYHQKYISKRDTYLLKNFNLDNAVDASIIDPKLKNLKWLTHHFPEDPKREIMNIKESIKIIKSDNRKKMLVTDYQFISVILEMNDNSAARIWWRHHIYPASNNLYFNEWKKFLFKKIFKENIDVIYTINPLEGESDIFKGLIESYCYSTKKINEILIEQILNDCKELKSLYAKE